MSKQTKLRYDDFVDRINVDALEEAIGFNPESSDGADDIGYCIWPENHANGDTTGKFAIEREKRVYNCWVCGGGSFLSLAMEYNDMDVDEALEWLYQFAGEDRRSDTEFLDEFMAAFEDAEKRISQMPYFNERVLEKFTGDIFDAYDEAHGDFWVNVKQIDPEVCDRYGVRYAETAMRPPPKNGRYSDDDAYTGPCIVFPHYWEGRLVGWQQRWLEPDDKRPEWVLKYTNTTELPRKITVYGMHQVPADAGPVVVVESVPSVLRLATVEVPAVATFGSNTNEAQLRLLRRFTRGVILSPDNDKPRKESAMPAGIKWRNALGDYLRKYVPVYYLPLVGERGSGDNIGDITDDDALRAHLARAYEPGVEL